jgi:FixJ family two-component response regulator
MTSENRVFVVDEDPSARKGIARLVRTANYAVRDFASTNDFFLALRSEVPGCVVLDAGMLGNSGGEMQTELKACSARLPIIVITTDDDPETRRKAQRVNAVGFFRKPVDGTALLDAIDWAFRSSNTARNN